MNALGARRYENGVAIVAGGSGGIGREICKELAIAGANVALTYNRNKESAAKVAQHIVSLGKATHFDQVDLSDAAAVVRFVNDVRAKFGAIHTVVYAAGPSFPLRHISQMDPDFFAEKVGTDVFGCFNLIRATIKDLRQTKGALVSLATPAIRRYAKADILSAAPKAAIETVVRGVAAEEGRFGVRANCVGVGVITDGMYHELVASGDFDEKFIEKSKEYISLNRLGTAQEIAGVVAFLSSDKASYVSGQILMVDGGYAV